MGFFRIYLAIGGGDPKKKNTRLLPVLFKILQKDKKNKNSAKRREEYWLRNFLETKSCMEFCSKHSKYPLQERHV